MLAIRGRALLACVLALLATSTSLSAATYGQARGGAGSQGGQQQIAAAMHDLSYAQRNVDLLKERAERALAHDKGWTTAKAAVVEAQKNLDAVREQVKQQTMAKPEYQTLALRVEQKSSETEAADARLTMANMVWDDQHNSSDCTEARARLQNAQADLDARWKDYETRVLAKDPNWTGAIAARDSARAQLSSAMGTRRSGTMRQSGVGTSSRSSYGRSGSSGSRGSRGRSTY